MQVSPRILGPDGNPVRMPVPAGPRGRVDVNRLLAAGFGAASYSDPDLASWTPSNYSAHSAYWPDRIPLLSRIHDLARNDGWVSGGITRQVDAIIGASFRLASKPNARILGISPDAAAELANEIEAAWKDYADDPDCWIDAGRRMTFSGLVALGFRHRLVDGEGMAAILYSERAGSKFGTCVQVIDPDRVTNPYNAVDTWFRRSGIELGELNEPVGYYIRLSHPGDMNVFNPNFWKWEFVPRETSWGRRVFVHAFEADRAGQYRGTPVLAPVVKRLKMLGRYDEAELQAAVLNAVMAAIVESPFDHDQLAASFGGGEELSSYQQSRIDYYQAAPVNLGGAKMMFTYPGEKVNLTKPQHPNSVFEHFTRASLRNIASAMGMTYEQLSMDWGQVNYSSARAALIEVWRGFTARREFFATQFCDPIFAAWLEEAIDLGRVKLPAGAPPFAEAKAAYTACRWIGPGRGWVDPQKEASAAVQRISAGLSTLEAEVAEQGGDYLEMLDQRARERKEMEARGLDPDAINAAAGKAKPSADDGEDEPKKKEAK